MLSFFETSLFLLILIEINSMTFSNKKMRNSRRAINPIHDKHLATLLLDLHDELAIGKKGVEATLNSQEEYNIFLVIIGKMGDNVSFT